jgi:subtilisin family serine protease
VAVRRPGLAFAVLLLTLVPAGGASAQRFSAEPAAGGGNKQPKLSSALVDLARERRADGPAAARARAAKFGLDIGAGGVLVQVTAHDVEAAMRAVGAVGGVVGDRFGPNLDARVPAAALHELAAAPAVARVARPPLMELLAVAGEGVAASGADAWHAGGLNGAGARVAIIDGGFAGLAAAQANGDLPANVITRDECGGGFHTNTDHGTAVAEIVHEMAPGAQLYLICTGTPAQLQAGKDFAASQGVNVMNFSAGFFATWRGDGSGPPGTPDQTVREARNQGILWVNAAGNHARRHWSGTFSDPDSNDQHNFSGGDEGNRFLIAGGREGCAILRWDDWPGSDQDYDLFLFFVPPPPGTPTQVASSEDPQTGTQPPVEGVCFTPPATGEYAVVILRANAPQSPSPRFDLFNAGATSDWSYFVEAGSLLEPATSPNAMTAGAICWQNDALEEYSSQGPNQAGVVKPDVAGYDSTSGFTFGAFAGTCGDDGFPGTSAAAPHVAGAATLVKGVRPRTFGPNETQSFLESRARDLMSPGEDNQTGFGELQLGGLLGPEPPPPPPPAPPTRGRGPTLGQVRGSCRRRGRGRRTRVTCTLRNARAVRRYGARLLRGRRTLGRVRGPGRRDRIVIRLRGRLRRGRYVLRVTLVGSQGRRRVMRLRFRVV